MATVTDSDLKELKELLTAGFSRIDGELAGLKSDLTDLKITVARMEERLAGQINVVDEKVNGLGKRLDFQEFINRGFLVGVGLTLITSLANFFGFLPKPPQ